MSAPDRPDPARGWRFVQKLLDSDPADLDHASDEEVERQMRAQHVALESTPSAEEIVSRAAARAASRVPVSPTATTATTATTTTTVVTTATTAAGTPGGVGGGVPSVAGPVSLRARRSRANRAWRGLAAAAATLLVVAAVERGGLLAWLHAEGPDARPTAQARTLREEAFTACRQRAFPVCAQKLDEAARLDPAGEGTAPVAEARRAIAQSLLDDRVDAPDARP